MFLKCLRVWSVDKHITIDVLMPPSERYYTDLFFQVKCSNFTHLLLPQVNVEHFIQHTFIFEENPNVDITPVRIVSSVSS
jgi:hypothetical protein